MPLLNHGWMVHLKQYGSKFYLANHPLYVCSFYRPPNNDPSPINQVNNAIAALYGRESDLARLIIAGDFNTPDIVWSEGFGHVKSNPSYGNTVNYSLVSDYHLE